MLCERYTVVDDKTRTILLETGFEPEINVWDWAYEYIQTHPDSDVYIDVYTSRGFSHWVDSERIVCEVEEARERQEA